MIWKCLTSRVNFFRVQKIHFVKVPICVTLLNESLRHCRVWGQELLVAKEEIQPANQEGDFIQPSPQKATTDIGICVRVTMGTRKFKMHLAMINWNIYGHEGVESRFWWRQEFRYDNLQVSEGYCFWAGCLLDNCFMFCLCLTRWAPVIYGIVIPINGQKWLANRGYNIYNPYNCMYNW